MVMMKEEPASLAEATTQMERVQGNSEVTALLKATMLHVREEYIVPHVTATFDNVVAQYRDKATTDKATRMSLRKALAMEQELRHHRAVMRSEFAAHATLEERMPDNGSRYNSSTKMIEFDGKDGIRMAEKKKVDVKDDNSSIDECYKAQQGLFEALCRERTNHVATVSATVPSIGAMVRAIDLWSLFDQVLNQVEAVLEAAPPAPKRARLEVVVPDKIVNFHYVRSTNPLASPLNTAQSWDPYDAEEMLMAVEKAAQAVKKLTFFISEH